MGKNLDLYYKFLLIYKIIKDVFLKIFVCIDIINIYIIDERENILLIFFSILNECFIMRILIEKGVDVNYVGENGWNVIYVLYVGLGIIDFYWQFFVCQIIIFFLIYKQCILLNNLILLV